MKKMEYVLVLGLLLIAFVVWQIYNKRPVRDNFFHLKLNSDYFAGDWIGYENSDQIFYNLHLSTDCSGYLVKVSSELNISDYYIITNWIVISNRAICKFMISTNPACPSELVCSFTAFPTFGGRLYGSEYGGWVESINFRRKANLETNLLMIESEILNLTIHRP